MLKSVLVIGGGISGIQAAIDLAEMGVKVHLVEESPSIGGHMARLDKTFPTNDCAMCILGPKMVEVSRHPNITLLTNSQVANVQGHVGNFQVKVQKEPRFVDENKCTGCAMCVEKCPVKAPNEHFAGMGERKAIYIPFPQAIPRKAIIEAENCLYFQKNICRVCEKICFAGAIDFEQRPETIDLNVGAIIAATGFGTYDPSQIKEYGYGIYKDVITHLQLEGLISASGPTAGNLLQPSDGKVPHRIAFIQCVGSRNAKANPYCCSICCMFATKESILIKEHNPEADVYIFFTDLRTAGKGSLEYINRAKQEYKVNYIRSRPGEITWEPKTNNLKVLYNVGREVRSKEVDLIVLVTTLLPKQGAKRLSDVLGIELNEHCFFKIKDPLSSPTDTNVPGIFVCGFCGGPTNITESVLQASGAAARAMEWIRRL